MRVFNDALLRLYVWIKDEKAQTMAEYGLLMALVSVGALGVLFALGTNLTNVFSAVADSLNPAAVP
jgi:Flp pilus assembly pilin Flp